MKGSHVGSCEGTDLEFTCPPFLSRIDRQSKWTGFSRWWRDEIVVVTTFWGFYVHDGIIFGRNFFASSSHFVDTDMLHIAYYVLRIDALYNRNRWRVWSWDRD